MVALAERKNELDKLGVQVFVISTDSKFVHKNWDESELCQMIEGGMPFPMLADQTGALGSVYGVYNETVGVNIRGTVVIDPEGVVQLLSINTPPLGRNPDEIVRCIQALQEHAKTGQVMPASWRPGEATLAPTYENAGKVWKVSGKK